MCFFHVCVDLPRAPSALAPPPPPAHGGASDTGHHTGARSSLGAPYLCAPHWMSSSMPTAHTYIPLSVCLCCCTWTRCVRRHGTPLYGYTTPHRTQEQGPTASYRTRHTVTKKDLRMHWYQLDFSGVVYVVEVVVVFRLFGALFAKTGRHPVRLEFFLSIYTVLFFPSTLLRCLLVTRRILRRVQDVYTTYSYLCSCSVPFFGGWTVRSSSCCW